MKKLAAVFLVVLVAGCSGMGMRSGGMSSSGGMGMSSDRTGYNPDNWSNQVINPATGHLNPYHGG